jgi:N-acetylglucosaminyldiphosphoundecaprenol N-acetyl-beta-D-mannosaminyltransferase
MEAPLFSVRRLFGLDFVADATISTVARHLALDAADPKQSWRCVVTPNVDHVVRYQRFPVEFQVARDAFVVLPDGMPIVWVSRLIGRPLRSRLTGADLFAELWPKIVESGVPTVAVTRDAHVARELSRDHGALACVVAPTFSLDDAGAVVAADADAVDALVLQIMEAVERRRPQFLFVGLSGPKAHVLAAALQDRWSDTELSSPTVLLVGAAPEFFLGMMRRAPAWMQRWGLEWLFRLGREPTRLARRYLVEDLRFLRLVWQEWRYVES